MKLDKSILNPQQFEAVETLQGPLLIIAGAGSGKTRVITFRIANMLENHIPQNAILALTFTNKAAREMEERVKELTGKKLSNLTVSTFHAFGVQVLKDHGVVLGYRPNFTIYDSDDSGTLIKECAREIGQTYDSAEIPDLLQLFSAIKTRRRTWSGEPADYKKLYQEYEDHLKLYNAVDFDDLIMKPIDLFEQHPEVLEEYRQRYKYIMVDEFQDTSISQFRVVQLLAEKHRNLCVVGDDDQSIYSWRGANYENILLFESTFSERKEIKLEQNYRSTGVILAAANAVIANNTNRKDKALWTGADGGKSIELGFPEDETQEGAFMAQTIKTLQFRENLKYDDVGILVRTNSQARSIELALLHENIPYKVSGGTSFFQRKEVKDIMAYLRLAHNPLDDVNFLRIINTPRRGVGRSALEQIVRLSSLKKYCHFEALKDIVVTEQNTIPRETVAELAEFVELIEDWGGRLTRPKVRLAPLVKELVDTLNYWDFLLGENPNSEKVAKWKYQNIEALIGFLEDWENDPENQKPGLQAFLNRVTLITRDDIGDRESGGAVNLMTIHGAKGLEWDVVFLAGVEDGIMPHAKSIEENPASLEEERRLFYVAITRARKKLFMTSCRIRRSSKDASTCTPSPFLQEIPQDLITTAPLEQPVADEDEAENFFEKLKGQFTLPGGDA